MLDRFRALLVTEPARVIALLTAVIVFASAKFGLMIDAQSVRESLLLILPVLMGGEVIRSQVSPAPPANVGPASDDLLPPEVTSGP